MTSTTPSVAIVMATYEPEPSLFRWQLQSLVDQVHGDFVCFVHDDASANGVETMVRAVVGDDPRFVVIEHSENLGFYGNFERGLVHAASLGTEFVALCDQDDIWYPSKLSASLQCLRSAHASLVFTDVVPVDVNRTVLGRSFFARRYPTTRSVVDLTLMNSVIGATAVFRSDLLELALPFPPARTRSFHDHWLARCAQFAGGLVHLPIVTMEYVQHGGNVQGFTPSRHRLRDFVAVTREPNTEAFEADHRLLTDRLAELHELRRRVSKNHPLLPGMQAAIDLHSACLAGSRRAALRIWAMWWRDQHLRARPRHEHVEIRYARAVARQRALSIPPSNPT